MKPCSGIITADLVVQELLREVMANIHYDPSVVDELFDLFKRPNLDQSYGQKTLEELKDYLKGTKINVLDGYQQLDTKLPAYIVYLGSSQEVNSEALLDDFGMEEYLDADGQVLDPQYKSQLETAGLVSESGKVDQFTTSIQENVIIDCLAHDKPLIARFLAYMLHYIVRVNKNVLIGRGLNRISLSFSDFHPWESHAQLPDLVYRRVATLSCQHYFNINQNVSDKLVSALCVQLKAQDDGTTNQGDEDNDIITTIE